MKTARIILNGNLSKGIGNIKPAKTDLIICADGGAEFAKKQKIHTHIIIGDCDSITPSTKLFFDKKRVLIKKYPREKDYTDAELAIQYALENGATTLVIYGLFGDRIDHMLSNIFHLSTIAEKVPCIFVEGNTEMQFADSKISLNGKKGDELSLIPLRGDVYGVTTTGLYYPLKNESLPFGSTRGISNVFLKKSIQISLSKGVLLVVHRRI